MSKLHTGPYGFAEQVPLLSTEPAIVGRWVTTTTIWHPQYRQHLLVVITLVDLDPLSSPPPTVLVDGATHALASATVDPAHPYQDGEPVRWMNPMNFEVQFSCPSDDRALAVLAACVEEVVDGNLNPESGNAPNLNKAEWQEFIEGALG